MRTYIGVDLLRAVVLVPILALSTLHATPDLSSNTDTVANLHMLYIRADSYGLADNLVANDTGWLESAW